VDYEATDKAMSLRVNEVFGDPKRHQFYSCRDAFKVDPHFGPRGGRIEGKARICFHCGGKRKGHAEKTEEL
jgi:hypothetical protein